MICLSCQSDIRSPNRSAHHAHMANHDQVRIASTPEYRKQIAADMKAGMVPAKDPRHVKQ